MTNLSDFIEQKSVVIIDFKLSKNLFVEENVMTSIRVDIAIFLKIVFFLLDIILP